MRRFKDCDPREKLPLALSLFARATLPKRSGAFGHMARMLENIYRGALPEACRCYHDAVDAMLASPARRVSGDLWRDELLFCLIQTESPFALCAARGVKDEAQLAAMREELGVLGELMQLTSEDVLRMMHGQQHAKPYAAKDNISLVSAAVWAGTNKPGHPPEDEPQQMPLPLTFTPWKYGEAGLADSFVSDEALEEIYLRLLEAEDWPAMADDLWSFFAAYGTGELLRGRAFVVQGESLLPLPDEVIAPLVPVSIYEQEHIALMENTIRFMRGESAQSMLLTGESGVGKTAHVVSLLHELPEVRLITAAQGGLEGLPAVIERLSHQPLKFVLLLDDIQPDSPELRRFASRMLGLRAMPQNVLLYGTSRSTAAGSVFDAALRFPYPTLEQFTTLISELLESSGEYADRQQVRNAAVDHQVDVREKLTFTGAKNIAESLKNRR